MPNHFQQIFKVYSTALHILPWHIIYLWLSCCCSSLLNFNFSWKRTNELFPGFFWLLKSADRSASFWRLQAELMNNLHTCENTQICLHLSRLHIRAIPCNISECSPKPLFGIEKLSHEFSHRQIFSVSPTPDNLQGYVSVSRYKDAVTASLSDLGSGAARQRGRADK